MTAPMAGGVRIVLVGGHESAEGRDLDRFAARLDDAHTAAPGRAFHNLVSSSLAEGHRVVVVPMTFGRNPTMVADTAKTLKWLGAKYPASLALAAPFGQHDHLTAWLRTAANEAARTDPDTALLIVAARSNPFDEAELHRIAYLVSTHGSVRETAVAIGDDTESMDAAAARLRLLGATRIVAVPAGFAAALPPASVAWEGPLMTDSAVLRVIRTRVREAESALRAGHDGIDDGLAADHGHGYAHSHAFEESQGGGHTHSHGGRPHTHTHGGHTHSHAHGEQAHTHGAHDHTHGAHDHTHGANEHEHDHDAVPAHRH